jgi:peptide/nickel transport system substrate-binding protein
MRRRLALVGLCATALGPSARAVPVRATRNTLRIAWRDPLLDVTPYFNSLRAGFVLAHQAWDCLLYRDPETFQLKPALATAFRWLDDTTIEFTLRSDVSFHNGEAFDAKDVVYTVQTAISDPRVAVPSNYAFILDAEQVDAVHVRVRLRQVFPAALEYVAMVLPILPKNYREKVGAAGYAQAPIGTGPYRVASIIGSERIVLERYDGYFEGSPKARPAIRELVIDTVVDADAVVARLLTGEADWIWQFDPQRLAEIARVPNLQVLTAESMRIGYMSFETRPDTPENPLASLEVRRALSQAIDRESIAREVGRGAARVLDAPCFPTQFGCAQNAAKRVIYDPAAARQALADAGRPGGFRTQLVSYVLPAINGIIRENLMAVGVEVELIELPAEVVVRRSAAGLNPLELGSWGSYSINDVSAILPYFFARGPQDHAQDPEIAALIERAGSVRDVDRRRADYAKAIRLITERALWLPLTSYVTTYGFSRALNFRAFADELPRFFLASWR